MRFPYTKAVANSCCRFVLINKYWDRTSKCLICVVDAGLNLYFSRTVRKRLVEQHGLVKYRPLASFNDKLMVVSVLMDVCTKTIYRVSWPANKKWI